MKSHRLAMLACAVTIAAATLPQAAAQPASTRVVGCMERQTYDVRPNGDFTLTFWIRDAAGATHQFGFGQGQITRITTGLPLVPASATLQWTRIIDTIERAAAANKPLWVEYENANNRVFGISADWSGRCRR